MRRTSAAAIIGLLALSVATPGVLAHPVDTSAASDEPESRHVTISDLVITVEDTHIEGANLPNKSIDEASYVIEEASISTDGFTVTFQGEPHRIGAITVTIDDVGIQLRNVSISGGTSKS